MSQPSLRKSLSAPGLLREVRRCFQAIKDDMAGRGPTLADCLLSGLAVFGLKYPSLLQFDAGRADEIVRSNLRSLYGIGRAPSGTALRERLDGVARTPGVRTAAITATDGTVHRFRYLNGAHFDQEVNFLDYEEQRLSGKVQHFTWVTDIPCTRPT